MPHTKRPLLLAALALVAFAALFNPAAAGDTAAVGTMNPPKEDALLMPTDAEADPAATDAAMRGFARRVLDAAPRPSCVVCIERGRAENYSTR